MCILRFKPLITVNCEIHMNLCMFEKNTEAFIVSTGGTYKNLCILKG